MNAEQRKIHARLRAERLPPKWLCEEAWPWCNGTHLVAPRRAGGVIVRDRTVKVQLPGDGICSDQIEIGHFYGRGWLDRMIGAALQAVVEYAPKFKSSSRRAR